VSHKTIAMRVVDELHKRGLYINRLSNNVIDDTLGTSEAVQQLAEVWGTLVDEAVSGPIAQRDLKPLNMPAGGGPVDAYAGRLHKLLIARAEHHEESARRTRLHVSGDSGRAFAAKDDMRASVCREMAALVLEAIE
jgi:hypothetical protein